MKKLLRLLLCIFTVMTLTACGGTRKEETVFTPATPSISGVKIQVTDVSNSTGEVFDVDVIGNLWDALDASLYQRGLLWDGNPGLQPLEMRSEIVEYQKGNFFLRSIFPPWGKTTIKAKCVLTDGNRLIASSETIQTITLGDGTLATNAWRTVFSLAAEDLIDQVVKKL